MFYIYHIKGVKIGCTINPKKRVNQQGYKEYEIIETHTDINTASKREIELQIQYGYKVDYIKYKQSSAMQKLSDCSAAGKIGGKIAGKITAIKQTGLHNPKKRNEWQELAVKTLYEKYSADELKQIRSKGSRKKRKLNDEQISFIKEHYYQRINQHEPLPPNKLGSNDLAKMFNVNKSIISRAYKS